VADRYAGRPLLRLIECYVLDAIGELGLQEDRQLRSTTAKIRTALGSHADTWQGAIAEGAAPLQGVMLLAG
jgi:hypothetical protein